MECPRPVAGAGAPRGLQTRRAPPEHGAAGFDSQPGLHPSSWTGLRRGRCYSGRGMTSPVETARTIDFEAGLRRLGYESFRPGQREAIETLMEVGRLLLVAPTGGGTSLSYQLPTVALPGTTLVIS